MAKRYPNHKKTRLIENPEVFMQETGKTSPPKAGDQLSLSFQDQYPSVSYAVKIDNHSIHEPNGFQHLGYLSQNFTNIDQIISLMHPGCRDRYVLTANSIFEQILNHQIGLTLDELKETTLKMLGAIKHADGHYEKFEQNSRLWFENGRIIGNKTLSILLGMFDPDHTSFPPDILVQVPIIYVGKTRRKDIENKIILDIAPKHIKKLGFTETELSVMNGLKKRKRAPRIADDLDLKVSYIRNLQSSILNKGKLEYPCFKDASEVALYYSSYRIC